MSNLDEVWVFVGVGVLSSLVLIALAGAAVAIMGIRLLSRDGSDALAVGTIAAGILVALASAYLVVLFVPVIFGSF